MLLFTMAFTRKCHTKHSGISRATLRVGPQAAASKMHMRYKNTHTYALTPTIHTLTQTHKRYMKTQTITQDYTIRT